VKGRDGISIQSQAVSGHGSDQRSCCSTVLHRKPRQHHRDNSLHSNINWNNSRDLVLQRVACGSLHAFKHFTYLKRFNTAAGILHLTQGIVMLLLGLLLEWTRDVYIFYLKLNIVSPGPPPVFDAVPNPEVLFIVGNACIICGSNSSQSIF